MSKILTLVFGTLLASILFNSVLVAQTYAAEALGSASQEKPLDPELLFSMVNNHRTKLNLPVFEKEDKVCSVAKSRGPQLYNEIFNGRMHSGLYNRNLPYWITENMIYMNTEEEALGWWLRSYIHRSQIQGNFKYACMECVGKACALVFTNYTPKATVAASVK